jgi:ketosteroid isomerase-like protein
VVSQENVDLWRKVFDAGQRLDWDTWDRYVDPDIFVRLDPSWPEQRLCGREALRRFWLDARRAMGSHARIEDMVDLGDRVLARLCANTHGQHSGVEGELRWSEIGTIREGRFVFTEMFLDHHQALKAVGLEA